MSIEIKVPAMGESVTEATIARWLKREGEPSSRTSRWSNLKPTKSILKCRRLPQAYFEHIEVPQGGTVAVGSVLGQVAEGAAGAGRRAQSLQPQEKEKPKIASRCRNPRLRHRLPCDASPKKSTLIPPPSRVRASMGRSRKQMR